MIFSEDTNIAADSTVEATPTAFDTLANRQTVEESGSIDISLVGTDLESGEPNAAGYTGTAWVEVPFNPESTEQVRITLTSPTSTGKVSVYKDPTLDDEEDPDDVDDDEMSGEPSLADLVLVQAASADQLVTLDDDYGSPYFLQVGLLTGTGDDFVLTWGDADPDEGGSFEGAIDGDGFAGLQTLNTSNAWLETGEPSSSGITETRSVWVKWTSPDTILTDTVFTVSGGNGAPFAAEIYTATDPNDITTLSAVSTGSSTGVSNITMTITPDPETEYWVRVASTVDGAGFAVAWSAPKGEFASVEPVSNLRVTVHAGVKGGTWAGRDYEPNELITELPERLNCQFQEALNVPGSGSITLMANDPMIRAFGPDDWPVTDDGSWAGAPLTAWTEDQFQLLQMGNFIKFWMYNSATDESDCVSAFIIKAREINVVGSNEYADRTITVSGPTVHQLLADFMVTHDNYPDTRNKEDRAFNWASIVGPGDTFSENGWFDKSGTYLTNKRAWNHPINVSAFKKPPGYKKKKSETAKQRPKYALVEAKKPAWPDKNAKWMWMANKKSKNQDTNFPPKGKKIKGIHYYRTKKFNITAGGKRYRFSAYSDTYYEIWLDGFLFMSGNGNENFKRFKHKVTSLKKSTPKRSHTIAVYVEDRKRKGKDTDHNDAFLLTVQQLNNKGKPKKVVFRSNRAGWVAWHGEHPPAWSRAMVLRTVIKEARDRDVDAAKLITIRNDFGLKSEEGSTWWDAKKVSMTVQVGTSALDLQQQFSESQRFDCWIDPDTLELFAWQGGNNGTFPRGTDRTNNVALVPGNNLINYTVSELDQVKNSLLVKYAGGYIYVHADTDAANYETMRRYGKREGFVELGGLHTDDATRAVAKSILTGLASAELYGGSSDIVGHVNEGYSGSVIPVRGAVPFLDWNVGDSIMAPSSNGILHPHRVLSLSCTEDADGKLTFDPELQGV